MNAFVLLIGLAAWAEPPAFEKRELKGAVDSVQIATPGPGPARLTIKTPDGKSHLVYLGPLRYLIDNDFNPKAGQRIEAVVLVHPDDQHLMAAHLTLPGLGRSLAFRDATGRPLWRGSMKKGALP